MSAPSQVYTPLSQLLKQDDVLLVQAAAQQSPIKYLQDAASSVLELIAAAEVSVQWMILVKIHTDVLNF